MIEFLSIDPGIVACRASGALTPDDTDALMHELELAIADEGEVEGKIDLYYEIDDDIRMSPSSVLHGLRIALDILARRKRLGRVAVVSDRLLLRTLWRIESMLMPQLSYRQFTHAHRAEALDWVAGRAEMPERATFRILTTDRDDLLGVEMGGFVAASDISRMVDEMDRLYRAGGLKRMAVVLDSDTDLEGLGVSDLDLVAACLAAMDRLDRFAIVGAPGWLERWIALLAPLLAFELRYFPASDKDQAWKWLEAKQIFEFADQREGELAP